MRINTAPNPSPQQKLEKQLQGKAAFYLPAPGVSLDQIDTFFETLEQEVFKGKSIGLSDLLPAPLAGLKSIFIRELAFSPALDPDPYHLSFTLAMDKAAWEVIPDLLSVEDIAVKVDIYGPFVTANLYGTLAIGKLNFNVAVELPSGYLSANLIPSHGQTAQDAFEHFQLPHIGKTGQFPSLKAFQLLAAPAARQASISMALSDINIGPVSMEMQLALDYSGHPKGYLTGSFMGNFLIKRTAPNEHIKMQVIARHDDPSSGWEFEGRLDLTGYAFNLSEFVANTLKDFTPHDLSLPDVFDDLPLLLKSIRLSFNSETKDFQFTCEVDAKGLFGHAVDLDFFLTIDLTRINIDKPTPTYAYQKNISGQLVFKVKTDNIPKDLEFDLTFSGDGKGQKTFVAVYQNLASSSLQISDLIKTVEKGKTIPDIPLAIELKDVFFAFTNQGGKTKYLFGIDIDSGINLAELPLVGNILGPENALKLAFQPIVTSANFTADEVQTIVDLVPDGKVSLPIKALTSRVDLACRLQIGNTPIQLNLPVQMANDNGSVEAAPPPTTPAATPGSNATAPNPVGDVHWFPIQKGFGPVYFNRIGAQFKKASSEFWFLLDTDLAAGPLTLTLDGLGVGSKLSPIKPQFALNGIGLDYQSGPLEIGGNFIKSNDTVPEYDGLAILKMETLNISALGSYARVNGETSLFIYATLDYPLGGPSFFFVKGLALGFGYNRQLKMPPIGGVANFPLVSAAMNGDTLPSGTTDRGAYLQDQLEQLKEYIPPRHGAYFLAVGVHFSSFELIDSFVLVSVSFGAHFEVDLLGLSRLVIPSPDEGAAVTPLAVGELAIKAVFDPERGFLGVQAQLTHNSYILSKQCHLTGGFAFFNWFKKDTLTKAQEGDFVLSLGGYHPAFKPPSYYPKVPRLGFNWRISSDLSIKGGMYFALTPNFLMAGGHLEANFDNGHVRAWFNASADFIVCWKPYHYDARFHIDVGGKVWILKFDAGADVHLWGPDFAGVATIHCSVVSFTVHFGDSSPSAKPISWDAFSSSFLPAAEKVCTVAVEKGLVKKVKKGSNGDHYIINPKEFSLVSNSVIPSTAAALKGDATPQKGSTFGIAPMNLGKEKDTNFSFIADITLNGVDHNDFFQAKAIHKNLPAALWGTQFRPGINDHSLVEKTLAGLRILPKNPPTPGITQLVEKTDLAYSINHIDHAFDFESNLVFTPPATKGTEEQDRALIQSTITAPTVTTKRNALLEALGLSQEIKQLSLSPDIATDFVTAPLVGTFSLT